MLLWKELFPFYPTLNSSLLCSRWLILDPWIVFVFFRIASYSSSNQMTASNLGIVFGPTLLRPLWVAYSLFGSVKHQHCVISFKYITMVVTFCLKSLIYFCPLLEREQAAWLHWLTRLIKLGLWSFWSLMSRWAYHFSTVLLL